jgi:hypothetical protein
LSRQSRCSATVTQQSKEIPEFDATRHELLQLVKYWEEVALNSDYGVFITGQIGSVDTAAAFRSPQHLTDR